MHTIYTVFLFRFFLHLCMNSPLNLVLTFSAKLTDIYIQEMARYITFLKLTKHSPAPILKSTISSPRGPYKHFEIQAVCIHTSQSMPMIDYAILLPNFHTFPPYITHHRRIRSISSDSHENSCRSVLNCWYACESSVTPYSCSIA